MVGETVGCGVGFVVGVLVGAAVTGDLVGAAVTGDLVGAAVTGDLVGLSVFSSTWTIMLE